MKSLALSFACLACLLAVCFQFRLMAQPAAQNIASSLAEKEEETFVKIRLSPVGKFHRTKSDMNTDNFLFGYSKIRSGENEPYFGRVVAARLENGMTVLVIANSLEEFEKSDLSELETKVHELKATGMRLLIEEMETPVLGCGRPME